MRSCRAKKAPDVTCSQSARAARGQVTSAAARLWVRMRGACRGGRGAGLAAAALRPLPSPRTPAPALKGAARRPSAVPGTPPPGSFPGPSALPCPGTPGLAARRLAEGRADRVPREGPFPPARQERATRPAPRAPQPLFVRGLRSRERVPRARPCGALSRSTALALSTTPGGGHLALHLAWEAIGGSEARELAWVTHLMNSGGGLPGSAILPAPLVTSTLAASGEKQPRNSAPRPTPPGCAPHPQGC